MTKKTVSLPKFGRNVEVRSASYDEADNTVEVIWTTGAPVRRYSWRDGVYYNEILEVSDAAVRLERLNAGAPFLNTHSDWSLEDVIGSVVPGSARIEGGVGYARVKLSSAPEDSAILSKIKDGIIRNVSVGYAIHKVEKTVNEQGGDEDWRVVDWEPMEISAVPIPADAGSQIRSERQGADVPCEFTTTRAVGRNEMVRKRMEMRERQAITRVAGHQ
jgi:HK97 family phage prohead protease